MEWLFLALLTALLAASVTLVVKHTLVKEHALEFSAILALFNVFMTIPFWGKIEWETITGPTILIIYAASLVATFAYYFVAKGVRHIPVSTASPMLTTQPIFLVLFAFLFIGERLEEVQLLGIGIIVMGAFIMELRKGDNGIDPFKRFFRGKHHLYIVGSVILYAAASTFDKLILSEYGVPVFTYMTIIHGFIALNFFILLSLLHNGVKDIAHGIKHAGIFILIASMLTVGMRTTQAFAVTQADVSLVMAIKRTAAIFVTIFGGSIFHEQNLTRKTIGVIVMVVGAILVII